MDAASDLPGVGLERLRMQLELRLPAAVFLALLHTLVKSGNIALDGAWESYIVLGRFSEDDHGTDGWREFERLLAALEKDGAG